MIEQNQKYQGLARVREATQFLGLSKSKVYLMMDAGEITYVKIGKCRRIPWPELRKLVKRNTVPARQS